jgi:hypothetical protein
VLRGASGQLAAQAHISLPYAQLQALKHHPEIGIAVWSSRTFEYREYGTVTFDDLKKKHVLRLPQSGEVLVDVARFKPPPLLPPVVKTETVMEFDEQSMDDGSIGGSRDIPTAPFGEGGWDDAYSRPYDLSTESIDPDWVSACLATRLGALRCKNQQELSKWVADLPDSRGPWFTLSSEHQKVADHIGASVLRAAVLRLEKTSVSGSRLEGIWIQSEKRLMRARIEQGVFPTVQYALASTEEVQDDVIAFYRGLEAFKRGAFLEESQTGHADAATVSTLGMPSRHQLWYKVPWIDMIRLVSTYKVPWGGRFGIVPQYFLNECRMDRAAANLTGWELPTAVCNDQTASQVEASRRSGQRQAEGI